MNMAARALERVGDNAVDIAEQVGFLVTGEFHEYTDATHCVEKGCWVADRRTPDPARRGRGVARRIGALQRWSARGSTCVAAEARRAIERFRTDAPDLVDPRPDAARAPRPRRLPADPRRSPTVPIIMVTAKDAEADKVTGLELGRRRLRHEAVLACGSSSPGSARICAGASMDGARPRRRDARGGPVAHGRRPPRGRGGRRADDVPPEGVRAPRDVPAAARAGCSPGSS